MLLVKDNTHTKFIVKKDYYSEFIKEYDQDDIERFEVTEINLIDGYQEI